ncbi:unnamed protein product [Sphenostylis stenocarpa]|uniref:Uncharacterized protein n=1 Tax=Sphenostylis stenocarpa TaxID=92480 RepID=A0AA86VXH8_9FABA|nr:unnamed protein product [Sphenostylis stenocarpa]
MIPFRERLVVNTDLFLRRIICDERESDGRWGHVVSMPHSLISQKEKACVLATITESRIDLESAPCCAIATGFLMPHHE